MAARGAVEGAATRASPERNVYVSGGPSAPAREIALLPSCGCRVRRAAVVYRLLQTSHVESTALLERGVAKGMGTTGGSSFLFAMFHGGGNLPLILPIVEELAARGHRVRVLAGARIWVPVPPSPAPLLDGITAAGAVPIPMAVPAVNPHVGAPPPRGLLLGRSHPRLRLARHLGIASWWAPSWAKAMAAELDRERPEVAIVDYFLFGAMAAAEHSGVPTAVLVHNATYPGPVPGLPPPYTGLCSTSSGLGRLRLRIWSAALRRAADREALPALNRARAGLGLAGLRSPFEQYQAAERVLILSSRAFDFAGGRLPANVRYVGTPFDRRPSPAWQSPWPADDARPLVLVSLSTLSQGQGPVLQRVLEAVGRLPIRALATVGPSLSAADFNAPANARLEAFVPHSSVLPAAAAVVTQCGLGTVAKALAQGVPLVCIPLIADQPDNAARVVAAGAGVGLDSGAGSAEIAAAIEAVVEQGRFREAAGRIAMLMSRELGAKTAAAEIEALALVSRA